MKGGETRSPHATTVLMHLYLCFCVPKHKANRRHWTSSLLNGSQNGLWTTNVIFKLRTNNFINIVMADNLSALDGFHVEVLDITVLVEFNLFAEMIEFGVSIDSYCLQERIHIFVTMWQLLKDEVPPSISQWMMPRKNRDKFYKENNTRDLSLDLLGVAQSRKSYFLF